jgi:hypothetical protein
MIGFHVPANTSLTHAQNAIQVVTVFDLYAGDTCGVYPNPQRAFEYVKDWLDARDSVKSEIRLHQTQPDQWDILVDGERMYVLETTHFRL